MDWDSHVTAVLAEWVLRWVMPPDRDECAWKHVLHHMVLVDRKGYDKFPEGRNILFCRMTPADKLRLMRGIPKKAIYLKDCIRAFWKLNLKQDLTNERHMRAESFWHNARFALNSTPGERKSFSTVLDVQIIGDIIDSSTNAPRSIENWSVWVRELYTEHAENIGEPAPSEGQIDSLTRRMHDLAAQVPQHVISAVQKQANETPKFEVDDIVALVRPDVQDQDAEMYVRVTTRGHSRVRLDAYGVPHDTGILNHDRSLVVKEVELWNTRSGGRVRGPAEALFPKKSGWLLDGRKVALDALKVSRG